MTGDAFFDVDGDGFAATEWTRGPWSRLHMHGGPPAALLARAVERVLAEKGGAPAHVVRLNVEFLRPLPIARFEATAEIVRAGRQVATATAVLLHEGRAVAQARALAIRVAPADVPAGPPAGWTPPAPAASRPLEFPFFAERVGYDKAMEGRIARGEWGHGAMAAWLRMRHPLVPGEAPTPLQRVMIAADSVNGVSVLLDTARFTFVNPDLTVYLHRPCEGEWVCLDATTVPQPDGAGVSHATLHDARGPIGWALQSLVIAARASGH